MPASRALNVGLWLLGPSTNTTEGTGAGVRCVFIDGHNNQSATFNARLAGMTAPFYGAG